MKLALTAVVAFVLTYTCAARADDCAAWGRMGFPPPQHCSEYADGTTAQMIMRSTAEGMNLTNATCVTWHLENYSRSVGAKKATDLAVKWCNALGQLAGN